MKCPVCSKDLVAENFGLTVHVCENGCKGIWFPFGELQQLDKPGTGMGAALEAALHSPRHNQNRDSIRCPKCDIPMHTHKFERDTEVNVDECYACGGFFLDSGELNEIRSHYMTDAEIQAYTDKLIATQVPQFGRAVREEGIEENRAQNIRSFTAFLAENYLRKKYE